MTLIFRCIITGYGKQKGHGRVKFDSRLWTRTRIVIHEEMKGVQYVIVRILVFPLQRSSVVTLYLLLLYLNVGHLIVRALAKYVSRRYDRPLR